MIGGLLGVTGAAARARRLVRVASVIAVLAAGVGAAGAGAAGADVAEADVAAVDIVEPAGGKPTGAHTARADAGESFEVSVDGGAWSAGPLLLVPAEVRFAPGADHDVSLRVRVVPPRPVELAIALHGDEADPLWSALDATLATPTGPAARKPPGRAGVLGPVRLRLAAGAEAALSLRLGLPVSAGDEAQRLQTALTLVLSAAEPPAPDADPGSDGREGGREGARASALAATGWAGASGDPVPAPVAATLVVLAGAAVLAGRALPRRVDRFTILGTCRRAARGRALDPGGARGDRRTRRRVGV